MLVERYQRLAYNVAFRTLGDPDGAADATQEAFLSAYSAIGRFQGGSFKAWLLRIVTNACFDAGRRISRRPTDSLDADDLLSERASELPDEQPDPGEILLRAEMVEHLQASILQLPFDQRATLILADVQGLSYEEVAEATGVSLGTVKSRLSRARMRLRDILRRQPELLPVHLRP